MPATPESYATMSKCPLPGPFHGNLGQPITPDDQDFIERLSYSELRKCIRADFRTPECFTVLSKLNRQLRICRAVSPQTGRAALALTGRIAYLAIADHD